MTIGGDYVGKDVVVTFKGARGVRCGKLFLTDREGIFVLKRYMGSSLRFSEKGVEDIKTVDGDLLEAELEALLKTGAFSDDFRLGDLMFFSAGAASAVRYLAERLSERTPGTSAREWEDAALKEGEKKARRFLGGKVESGKDKRNESG